MQVPLYRHNLYNCDIDEIVSDMKDLLSGMSISSGPVSQEVGGMLKDRLGVNHCSLTSNWTVGCLALLLAFDFKPGSEIIIPACTFIATANVIRLANLKPVVVDIDPKTKLMDFNKVMAAITPNTAAVMPVHLYGQMVDVATLRQLLPPRIKIIEDAAHALEASINGIKPGQITDAAVFSFYASKNMTTGEGGAVVMNDPDLHTRFLKTHRHGIELTGWQRHHTNSYVHAVPEVLALKANMPDILAILLKHQLQVSDKTQAMRQDTVNKYTIGLGKLVELPEEQANIHHARHMFAIGVDANKRDALLDHLVANGVKPAVHYMSLTHTPALKELDLSPCPVAEAWGQQCISIPMFAGITDSEIAYVIDVVKTGLQT